MPYRSQLNIARKAELPISPTSRGGLCRWNVLLELFIANTFNIHKYDVDDGRRFKNSLINLHVI